MVDCRYAENWVNREEWLVTRNGRLICLDWDCYCTECRVDESRDYVFEVRK